MLNYLSFRHYERWDWTEHDLYTLSQRSVEVVRSLDRPVDIWIVLSEAEPEFRELRNLLARYSAESRRITVHYVDPDRDPQGYRDLQRRFGLGLAAIGEATASDVAAVVATEDRHWEISRDDLLRRSIDPFGESEDEIRLDVESERALTGALVELLTGRPTKVCVTRGHGEYEVEGSERSLAFFRDEMRRENLELESIETRGRRRIAAECDVVAVVGPQTVFLDEEVDLLRDYLRGGGNLLLAFDPIPDRDQTSVRPTGFEAALRELGISLDADLVIEPTRELMPAQVGSPLGPFFAAEMPEHPITQHLRGEPLLVAEVRSVRPLDEERVQWILRTSERSYAERDLGSLADADTLEAGDGDLPGPVPIAVATQVEVTRPGEAHRDEEGEEQERPGGRLVVLGDASIFDPAFMAAPTMVNRFFASAAVGWLARREALAAIPARSFNQRPVTMTADDASSIAFRVLVLMPLAFVFLGVAVWWSRRQ
ncbi:MAG: GldG family protein, partial [Sandaracinaceae bacterium]|nr:GldG family protein [Sandaracinaceae bacterium]